MSTVTLGPQFVIDGPVPEPPPYRLLSGTNPSVEIIDDASAHWQAGVMVWSYPSDIPHVWDGCIDDPGTAVKAAGGTIKLPVFSAYTIYFPITCTMLGIDPDNIDEWQNRAFRAIAATESHIIEDEISKGTHLPLKPHFGDANVTLLDAGAVNAEKAALGRLADAVGATGRQGLIHATPATVVGFTELDLYRDREGIFSADGIPMVRGSGYIGATPTGGAAAASGQAWAYATGPMKILRGPTYGVPDTPAEALDRSNNVYTFMAERSYLVIWDTVLQAAVLVDWTA